MKEGECVCVRKVERTNKEENAIKKAIAARAKADEQANRLGYPLTPDITAVERHYNRSKKIRRAIYTFMVEELERVFVDFEDMADQAGNVAKCSSATAKRWIRQYAASNADFVLLEEDRVIAGRPGR